MKKVQCESCLKYFKKKEIEEIALTHEKLCKECYERRIRFNQLADPYPFP